MNRKVFWSILAVIFLIGLTSCGSSSKKTTPPPVVAITATSGSGQSAVVGVAFTNPLTATVTTGGTPTANVSVTFTAPAAGASGTFATATPGATDTEMTNASGVATSQVFTANTTTGTYTVTASTTGAAANASFSLTNTAGAPANLAATSGNGQSATISTAFTNPLVATVTDGGGNGVAGQSVTFTAPATGASGLFADGGTPAVTDTETTDATGKATSTVFTANATVGGPYNVVATSGTLTAVNFALTNTAVVIVGSSNYSFYLSGVDILPAGSGNYLFLALAGSVTIDATGAVLAGEQDYNDALAVTSPVGGDTITGGTLTVDASGQGTLTLITNNASVGNAGTETLGVQFVNTSHALIISFDGTATSSGSMDVQTLPSTPSGGFAFTTSGVDSLYNPTASAGVFTITGTAVAGVTDQNDAGNLTPNQAFTGTLSAADTFGRGTLTITGSASLPLVYYIVGPKVMRVIGMDTNKASVGSAFGQGAGTFSNASLGSSVLALAGSSYASGVGGADALAQFSTNSTSSNPANFTGVGDDNEVANGVQSTASTISGTYTIASNGYGSMTITNAGLGDVSALGIYMTDPALNLNDPNNTTTGLGGGLVLDMDAILPGVTGVLTPQTDTTAASFAGNYAVDAQDFNAFVGCPSGLSVCEFDLVAQGSMAAGGALSLTGDVSDPVFSLGVGGSGSYMGATFTSTPQADGANPGRYSMLQSNTTPNPLAAKINGVAGTFDVVIYQADGTQLYWLEVDTNAVWIGPVTQQGSLANLPAVRKAAAKTQMKQKR